MNKLLFISLVLFVFSCSKTTRAYRHLEGNWELVSFSQVQFNGLTYKFSTVSGSAFFGDLRRSDSSTYSLQIRAEGTDTVDFSWNGNVGKIDHRTFQLNHNGNLVRVDINRQSKVDLSISFLQTNFLTANAVFRKR